jgi:hypothetical protein
MTGRRRFTRLLATAGAVLALAVCTAGPASAHAGDPTLVTRLNGVNPALPDGVSVTLRTTVADQLVATNPTDTPLVVLDADGAEFLRITGDGVQGNTSSPYFHLSGAPSEIRTAVPPTAVPGATPQWVPLAEEPSWAWYDPRLSTGFLQVPVGGRQDVSEAEELASWSVPVRYGDTPASVDGSVIRRPVEGRFETVMDPVPAGVSAVIGQGYLPSLSLQAATGREVTVLGSDGEPYLRLRPDAAEVNRDSPTHRDDLHGRGRPLTAEDTGWAALPGTTTTWLDPRLRFPAEDPPAEAAKATAPVDVMTWEVPLLVDGTPQALTGTVRWLPNPPRLGEGSPWTTVGIVGGVVLLLGGGIALLVRNRRLAAAEPETESDRADEEFRTRA